MHQQCDWVESAPTENHYFLERLCYNKFVHFIYRYMGIGLSAAEVKTDRLPG